MLRIEELTETENNFLNEINERYKNQEEPVVCYDENDNEDLQEMLYKYENQIPFDKFMYIIRFLADINESNLGGRHILPCNINFFKPIKKDTINIKKFKKEIKDFEKELQHAEWMIYLTWQTIRYITSSATAYAYFELGVDDIIGDKRYLSLDYIFSIEKDEKLSVEKLERICKFLKSHGHSNGGLWKEVISGLHAAGSNILRYEDTRKWFISFIGEDSIPATIAIQDLILISDSISDETTARLMTNKGFKNILKEGNRYYNRDNKELNLLFRESFKKFQVKVMTSKILFNSVLNNEIKRFLKNDEIIRKLMDARLLEKEDLEKLDFDFSSLLISDGAKLYLQLGDD